MKSFRVGLFRYVDFSWIRVFGTMGDMVYVFFD